MGRVFFPEISQGVYRITWFGKIEFNIAGAEILFTFNCLLYQEEAVMFIKQAVFFLERVVGRNDKPDFMNRMVVRNMVCDNKVAGVYRVKGTEIETDMH